MTTAEIRAVVEDVLGHIPYDPPISLEYCEAVWKELRKRVPKGVVEVFHRHIDLNVLVRLGKAKYEICLPLV